MEGSEGDPEVDVGAYDLAGLRQELTDLADMQRVGLQTLKWTTIGVVVVGLVTWIAFDGRMPGWVLVPFMLGAVGLASVAVVLGAISVVLRNHLEAATSAAGRVLDTLALAHRDLDRVAAGTARLSLPDLVDEVVDQALIPGFRDGMSTMVPSPLRFLVAPLAWLPTKVVERTVAEILERLPVAEFGRLAPGDAAAAGEEVGRLRAAYASLPEDLGQARDGLESVTRRAMGLTVAPLVALIVVSALPLLGWLAIGWLAT